MKRIFQTLILLITIISFNQNLKGQIQKLDGVLEVELHNLGTIKEGDQVTGYYMFYKTDKDKEGFSSFNLDILDPELNTVISKQMTISDKTILLSAVSNGESIIFKFLERLKKEGKIKYEAFNFAGENIFSKSITITEYSEFAMHKNTDNSLNVFGTAGVPNYGYVEYLPKKLDKMSYKMSYMPSNQSTLAWVSNGSSNKYESAQHICVIDTMIISLVTSRLKKYSTKDMSYTVQAINVKTGKTMFSENLQDQGINAQIYNGSPTSNQKNIVLYGMYYPEGETMNTESEGLIKIVLDTKGKLVEKFMLPWEENFERKGNKKDYYGNMFFHKFVYGDDEKTFLIAEQFGLNLGESLLASALTNGGALSYEINDLMVIELNKDFKIDKIEIIEKSQNSHLAQTLPIGSNQAFGYLMNYYGWFDFAYMQTKDKPGDFTIGYTNVEKIKGEKSKLVFCGVSRTNSAYSYDKIPISVKGSEIRVMEGKPGYVCLIEYNKKEKSLDLRLEKINF